MKCKKDKENMAPGRKDSRKVSIDLNGVPIYINML